jgi:hypothetical protein
VAASSGELPLISVVIVNYKVADYTLQALRSLQDAERYDRTEVIIVDNASDDDSEARVTAEFPEVRWIGLKNNVGFGKACNVGALDATGHYLLFLNPDTLVSQNTLEKCLDFLNQNEQIGIVGPKILNPDGSFQASCRRSFPTPFNAFCHFAGLSRLFPKSKVFGRYDFTYMDPDVSMEVDAVSGSFMMMPRVLFDDIGGFDESFFMYGEDLDICARVKKQGLKVWYLPDTQIVHFKGKSSMRKQLRSRFASYEAMVLFSRKYRNSYGTYFPGWLVALGIFLLAAVSFGAMFVRTTTATLIDLLVINGLLWAGITVRFSFTDLAVPYQSGLLGPMLAMHGLLSLLFLLTLGYRGVYTSERYSPASTLGAGLTASVIFMAFLYFVKPLAFSRIAFAISALLISLALVGWRELISRGREQVRRHLFSTGNVVIVGSDRVAGRLITNTERDRSARIKGIIWTRNGSTPIPGEYRGYPVLGTLEDLRTILERHRTDLLLIATADSWYSAVIDALASSRLHHLTIKWVPHELVDTSQEDLPEVIPLKNFSV